MISASWIEDWKRIVPFLAFPPDLRRAVYTTNTIEALNRQIRKIIKTRGSVPDEDSARKLLYLAITRAQGKWRHTYNWSTRSPRCASTSATGPQTPQSDTHTLTPNRSNRYLHSALTQKV
jgi:transposase-like protein